MPYIVNFTDRENKVPITVFDNTSNTDTSLTFPGRNVTGYGQIIAENFLSLLENFAKSEAPANPIEGQLWYDSVNGVLQIWDNVQWKAASNIQKSSVEPATESSSIGELWVDTTNQQLYIFSGTRWILVGPTFSSGLRSGPIVERLDDSDSISRVIVTFYIDDLPIFIVSKDTFTPKIAISGFSTIRTGLNLTTELVDTAELVTKLYSRATVADSLRIGETDVAAGKFLRSDTVNITDFAFTVRNNQGLSIGANSNLKLSSSDTQSTIYNNSQGGSIVFNINRSGTPESILTIIDNKIGINNTNPDETLDVAGNVKISNTLLVTNNNISTNISNGSIVTQGGVAIGKNLIVADSLNVGGTSNLAITQPQLNDTYDLGTVASRWNNVRAKRIVADEILGTLNGNIVGNATTATNLRFTTEFAITGDITAPSITFDGQVGGLTKTFTTTLTSNIIVSKSTPVPNRSIAEDQILVFRPGAGLLKENRNVFVGDLAVPIGGIMVFAGQNAPYGFLLCDGSEVEIDKYPDLYDIIGATYGAGTLGFRTFKLPDLRGRFALGRDNMDNALTVPNVSGSPVDAGGGLANRVSGINAQVLGGTGGSNETSLIVDNLPQHTHNMRSEREQYYAVRNATGITDPEAITQAGGTTAGQVQMLPSSGEIDTPGLTNQPFAIMNPYLTMNYIIRSGPPEF
jgi:microcystin-dependent protein